MSETAEQSQDDSQPVLAGEHLAKTYQQGMLHVEVLHDINFYVMPGESVAVVGASGSGKSTLLNLLGGLDLPTAGKVWLDGRDIFQLSDNQRGELRNRHMGFVYQFHHLLAEFTALENVAMPLWIGKMAKAEGKQQAAAMLERVGLGERLEHKPSELSGGERQRVAIARALVTHPQVVLMDEPTGNLDRKAAEAIHDLMMDLNREFHTSIVIVTHDEHLAAQMHRSVLLDDGTLKPVDLAS